MGVFLGMLVSWMKKPRYGEIEERVFFSILVGRRDDADAVDG